MNDVTLECTSVEKRSDNRYLFKMMPIYPTGDQTEVVAVVGSTEDAAPIPGQIYQLMLRGMFVQKETSGRIVCEVSSFESKSVLKGISLKERAEIEYSK